MWQIMVNLRNSSRDNSLTKNDWQLSHQRTIWRNLSPAERLRRSWSMRQLLKNERAIHDKKLFPHP